MGMYECDCGFVCVCVCVMCTRMGHKKQILIFQRRKILDYSYLLISMEDWFQDSAPPPNPHGQQNPRKCKSLIHKSMVFAYDLCTSSHIL